MTNKKTSTKKTAKRTTKKHASNPPAYYCCWLVPSCLTNYLDKCSEAMILNRLQNLIS